MHRRHLGSCPPPFPDFYPRRERPQVHDLSMLEVLDDHESRRSVRAGRKVFQTTAQLVGRLKYNFSPPVVRRRIAIAGGVLAVGGALAAGLAAHTAHQYESRGDSTTTTGEEAIVFDGPNAGGGESGEAMRDYDAASDWAHVAADIAELAALGLISDMILLGAAAQRPRGWIASSERPERYELLQSGIATVGHAIGSVSMTTTALGPQSFANPASVLPPAEF